MKRYDCVLSGLVAALLAGLVGCQSTTHGPRTTAPPAPATAPATVPAPASAPAPTPTFDGELWENAEPRVPWQPHPLEGPLEQLSAVCDILRMDDCEPDAPEVAPVTARSGAFREVRLYQIEDGCHLGIRTNSGWFVSDSIEMCHNRGSQRIHMQVDELAIRDVIGDAEAELVLRTTTNSHHHIEGGVTTEAVLVCGIGPTARPSCTRRLPVKRQRWSWTEDGDERIDSTLTTAIEFTRSGVTIELVSGELSRHDGALVGEHPIVFP